MKVESGKLSQRGGGWAAEQRGARGCTIVKDGKEGEPWVELRTHAHTPGSQPRHPQSSWGTPTQLCMPPTRAAMEPSGPRGPP